MLSFKSFISKTELNEGMPKNLENFLHHLSSPVNTSEDKELNEADVTALGQRMNKLKKTQGLLIKEQLFLKELLLINI